LNGPSESVVYIDNSKNKINGNISLLENSTFIQNQGVVIYISHTSLFLNNLVSFKDNKATDSAAIYSSNSIIKFDDKCNTRFYNNSAIDKGGAMYNTNSTIYFKENSVVMFTSNIATDGHGGAIFQVFSVKFKSNTAADVAGRAVYLIISKLFFSMNAKIRFSGNVAKAQHLVNRHTK